MCAERTYSVSVFQTTSTKSKSLLPTAAHGCCSPKSILAAAFSSWSPSSTATVVISASQKSDKTSWPGQAPIRNIPISSGTEPDYFRSTPTKATIPISVPTKIPTNHWHRYTTTPIPKTKTDNRLTTSTATNQQTERDDRHPRQSVVVRRLHRLKSSKRGNQGSGYRLPFRLQNQYYKGTSWSPSSNINAFIATDLLTKRR